MIKKGHNNLELQKISHNSSFIDLEKNQYISSLPIFFTNDLIPDKYLKTLSISKKNSKTYSEHSKNDIDYYSYGLKMKEAQLSYNEHEKKIKKLKSDIEFLNNRLICYFFYDSFNFRKKVKNSIEKLKKKIDDVELKKYRIAILITKYWKKIDQNQDLMRNFSCKE